MPNIKFSKQLLSVLNKMFDESNNYPAFELIIMSEADTPYHNGLNIKYIDVGKDGHFSVKIKDSYEAMRVDRFFQYYFSKSYFYQEEIEEFINYYNLIKSGKPIEKNLDAISIDEDNVSPKDIRKTFLLLTQYTHPYGYEKQLLKYLPKVEKDLAGNYYIIVGDDKTPNVMFASHLDTANTKQIKTKLFSKKGSKDEFIVTDGQSNMGADDKAGISILLYMIHHNIPGLYYFFIGEEQGRIGSLALSEDFYNISYLKNINKCISFDRRGENSIITKQLSDRCCSKEFTDSLINEYSSSGLNFSDDPTGIYTDSASFMDKIPECTNISVGYYNEHTRNETQNIDFLQRVAEASTKVNWNDLPVKRPLKKISEKYIKLSKKIQNINKKLKVSVVDEDENSYIIIFFNYYVDFSDILNTLTKLRKILKSNKIEIEKPVLLENTIKIKIK